MWAQAGNALVFKGSDGLDLLHCSASMGKGDNALVCHRMG